MEEEQRDDLTALAQLKRTIKWKAQAGDQKVARPPRSLDYLKSLMTFRNLNIFIHRYVPRA